MAKRKAKEKPTDKAPVKMREMTPAEQARYEAYKAREQATPGAIKYADPKIVNGVRTMGWRETDPYGAKVAARAAATGTLDDDAAAKLLLQAITAVPPFHEEMGPHSNAVVAMMTDIAPKDGLEGLLVAQMVACHNAAMENLRLAHVRDQSFEWSKLHSTFADRFLRTFTAQVEALAKYRGKGQQKVTVEHVHVHQGGQAIVGNVTTGGGGHGTGNDGTTSSQRAIEAAGESITLRSADGAEVWSALQGDGEAVPATGHAERTL